MSCLDANAVLEYVEGLLSPEAAHEVELHAAQCAECRELLADAGAAVLQETHSAVATQDQLTLTERRPSRPFGIHVPPPRMPPALQQTYELGRCIGEGGMGVVYEASHRRLPRRFAIKFLSRAKPTDQTAIQRMQREAEITSSLSHPNIVEVFDFNYTEDGIPFIVMELLEGEALSERLKREGAITDLAQVTEIVRQVASALAAAHDKGVVHRDLKPSNIFICRRGARGNFIKLVDFGLSKALASGAANLTAVDAVMGSPQYMTPEQAEGHSAEVDQRSDVFSLGATLYHVLTGQYPYGRMPVGQILVAVAEGQLCRSPGWQVVPPAVRAVLQRATALRPQHRQQSMHQLWQEFADAVRTDSATSVESLGQQTFDTPLLPSVRAVSRRRRRQHLRLAAAVALGAVLLGAVLGLVVRLAQGPEELPPAGALGGAGLALAPPDSAPLRHARDSGAPEPTPDAFAAAPLPPDAAPPPADLRPPRRPERPHPHHRPKPRVGPRRTSPPAKRPRGAGTLVIQSKAASDGRYLWADVYLDGRHVGQTPLTLNRVAAGTHRIRVQRAGFTGHTRRVTVRAGRRTQVRFTLRGP